MLGDEADVVCDLASHKWMVGLGRRWALFFEIISLLLTLVVQVYRGAQSYLLTPASKAVMLCQTT